MREWIVVLCSEECGDERQVVFVFLCFCVLCLCCVMCDV